MSLSYDTAAAHAEAERLRAENASLRADNADLRAYIAVLVEPDADRGRQQAARDHAMGGPR